MKYSLDEIDFMRKCVAALTMNVSCCYGHMGEHGEVFVTSRSCSICFLEYIEKNVLSSIVEQQLRTLMSNGTTPYELSERIKKRLQTAGFDAEFVKDFAFWPRNEEE